MKEILKWQGKMAFEARTESGHSLVLDASPQVGGENRGPRPTEVLLAAAGACSGIDMVDILGKMRQEMTGLEIEVQGERAEDHPRRFVKVHIHYRVTGKSLDERKVARAIELSLEKYCSVSRSLNAEIDSSYEVLEG